MLITMLRAIDGFARSIDCAAPSMDPLIAHLSVDRAIINRSRNYRNCAIDQLRTAEFAQSIDRVVIESAQSVDCLRSISSHLGTCLLLVSKYYGFLLHMFYLGLPSLSLGLIINTYKWTFKVYVYVKNWYCVQLNQST